MCRSVRLPAMDQPAESSAPVRKPVAAARKGAGRWLLPRLPTLIGVVGLGAVATTGTWFKRQADERQQAEVHAMRAELTAVKATAEEYRLRMQALRWQAERYRAAATQAMEEPLRSWAIERARQFDALVAAVDRSAQEKALEAESADLEKLWAAGDIAAARERVMRLPVVEFPSARRFQELQAKTYAVPLAEFSRRNPGYYRLFQQAEPEAGKADLAALRAELTQRGVDELTPQTMLKFDLLATVAPPEDPLLVEWTALATAPDYLENPDAAALAAWRRAQQALRVQDWGGAVAQMQSILKSKVRTRQPFRAAYARAVLRNTPDDTAAAYPFMVEAAAGGEAAARAWVAEEDAAQGRYGQALRWLEAGLADGDPAAVAPVLKIYAMDAKAVPRDLAQEQGVLERITVAPDAPPLALMLLARLYETGEAGNKAPAQALACYQRAAERSHAPALAEMARCRLRGIGAAVDYDAASAWAVRAFEAGEREKAIAILIEIMQRAPERAANAVQTMIEHEQVAAPAGFSDVRTGGSSMAQLQTLLARYLDQRGRFGDAARFYAQSGNHDPAVVARHAELTTAHPCEACGGAGKIQTFTPCPTCSGKGTVICSVCDGRGYSFVPGTPPCTTCGGSGSMEQEGRSVACGACSGTGKGKGSVIKQTCPTCAHGRVPCRECTGGRIKVMKECPECHGTGARALADG